MNDRELLEMAAKAARVSAYWSTDGTIQARPLFVVSLIGAPYEEEWNPLKSDGCALRLAVKLRLVLHIWDDGKLASAAKTMPDGRDPPLEDASLWFSADAQASGGLEAATRRAIVRAAAKIGEADKGGE